MFKLIKVTGNSLYPEYCEGDYVMIITLPFFLFKEGDTVIFDHPVYGRMIKIVESIVSEEIFVIGRWTGSVDSRQFGPINRNSIVGKVVWHIKRPLGKTQ